MIRLIIETSTARASLALFDRETLLTEEQFPGGRNAVSPFFTILQRLLSTVPVLDEVVVGVGPGSYSGIRIGISAALGLQMARTIPARGVNSLAGFAGADYDVLLNARGSFVFGSVREGALVAGPAQISPIDLPVLHSGIPTYSPDAISGLKIVQAFPNAALLGQRLLSGKIADLPVLPLYLKAPHITLAAAETAIAFRAAC